MTSPRADTEPITCPGCEADSFVADLEFPEPDEDTNTQFGWLIARCPNCGEDLKVGYDRVAPLLFDEDEEPA